MKSNILSKAEGLAEELAIINSTLKSSSKPDTKLLTRKEEILKELKIISSSLKSTRDEKTSTKSSKDLDKVSVSGSVEAVNNLKTFLDKTRISEKEPKAGGSVKIDADICFLIDATGSMQPWIDGVKSKIKDLIKHILKTFGDVSCRIGFIAYRDFDKGSSSFEKQDLTSDASRVEEYMSKIVADGGEDGAEDINGAIQKVLTEIEWKSNIKILIHFADAPCHGPDYHNTTDNHPSPSSDKSWEYLLEELKKKGIQYNFMELNSSMTRKMTDEFSRIWASKEDSRGSVPALFKVYPVDSRPEDLFPKIVDSVKTTINHTIGTKTDPVAIMKGLGISFGGPTLFDKLSSVKK